MYEAGGRVALEPYVLSNCTGVNVYYWMGTNPPKLLNSGEEVPIPKIRKMDQTSSSMTFQLEGEFVPIVDIPISRAGACTVRITPDTRDPIYLIYEVAFRKASRIITLRSSLLVHNATTSDVCVQLIPDIYGSDDRRQSLIEQDRIRGAVEVRIQPGSTLPLPILYCSRTRARFRPEGDIFNWSDVTLELDRVKKKAKSFVTQCSRNVRVEDDRFLDSFQQSQTFLYCVTISPNFPDDKTSSISLYPPLLIENLLPCRLSFRVINKKTGTTNSQGTLHRGEEASIHFMEMNERFALSLQLVGFQWSPIVDINVSSPVDQVEILDDQNRTLILRLENTMTKTGMRKILVYCKYWFINKTGLRLLYKQMYLGNIAAGQSDWENLEYNLDSNYQRWYSDSESDKSKKKPFLFDFVSTLDIRDSRLSVKIADSTWCKGFLLSGEGTSGVIEISDRYEEGKPTRFFQLVMYVESAKTKYWRSKVVVFAPHYVVINQTPKVLMFSQAPHTLKGDPYVLNPDQQIPFHWPNIYGTNRVQISFQEAGWNWSAIFPIDKIGSFTFKMRDTDSNLVFLTKVDIRIEKKTIFICISPENTEFPIYRIDNLTSNVLLLLRQKGFHTIDYVRPGEIAPYAWDEPSDSSQTIQVQFDKGTGLIREFQLDELGEYPSVDTTDTVTQERLILKCEVLAEGPTKVLRIREEKKEARTDFLETVEEEEITMACVISLSNIGFSVINEIPEELLFLSVSNIEFEYSYSNLNTKAEFRIGYLQLDNQLLYPNIHPVLLIPIKTPNQTNFFHLSMIKNNQSKSIDFIRYFSFLLQEVDINLDEVLLLELLRFASVIMDFYEERETNQGVEDQTVVKVNPSESKMIYFQLLLLQPIKLNVTFTHIAGYSLFM
jgi:hypothetical protein